MTSLLNFIKIYQLVQTLLWGTHRQTGDLISLAVKYSYLKDVNTPKIHACFQWRNKIIYIEINGYQYDINNLTEDSKSGACWEHTTSEQFLQWPQRLVANVYARLTVQRDREAFTAKHISCLLLALTLRSAPVTHKLVLLDKRSTEGIPFEARAVFTRSYKSNLTYIESIIFWNRC
jgi:hypothetical protein